MTSATGGGISRAQHEGLWRHLEAEKHEIYSSEKFRLPPGAHPKGTAELRQTRKKAIAHSVLAAGLLSLGKVNSDWVEKRGSCPPYATRKRKTLPREKGNDFRVRTASLNICRDYFGF